MKTIAGVTVLSILLLAGCGPITTGVKLENVNTSQFVVGKTTLQQVVTAYGAKCYASTDARPADPTLVGCALYVSADGSMKLLTYGQEVDTQNFDGTFNDADRTVQYVFNKDDVLQVGPTTNASCSGDVDGYRFPGACSAHANLPPTVQERADSAKEAAQIRKETAKLASPAVASSVP